MVGILYNKLFSCFAGMVRLQIQRFEKFTKNDENINVGVGKLQIQ